MITKFFVDLSFFLYLTIPKAKFRLLESILIDIGFENVDPHVQYLVFDPF